MNRSSLKRWQRKHSTIKQMARPHRQASILVCVIVVMIICGALSFQSSRSLGLTLQNVETRALTDQLQELLALGRLRLKQQLALENGYAGESFDVALGLDDSNNNSSNALGELAKISIEPLPPGSETEPQQWRVVASFTHPAWSSIAAQWESR